MSNMSKSDKNVNIRLEAFRKKNSLRQEEVAKAIGVSRGFISMVETGDSKFSEGTFDALLRASEQNCWDTTILVPAYWRLLRLVPFILDKRPWLNTSGFEGVLEGEEENVLNDGVKALSYDTLHKIKYGMIGINDILADAIVKEYPEINRQWLVDGTGDMLFAPDNKPSELEALKEEVQLLRASIESLRAENIRLLSSLPKLVADEISGRSEQSVSKKE